MMPNNLARSNDRASNDVDFGLAAACPPTLDCICSACPLDDFNLCAAANRALAERLVVDDNDDFLDVTEHTVPARRIVWHPKDWSEYVPVICRGWATSSITLANGERQILSFLLPGDIVSTATLFGVISGRTIEAVTDVTFRKFRRNDVQLLLQREPTFFQSLSRAWLQEREQADNLAVDLGRRMADARIARLILQLFQVTTRRKLAIGLSMPFPLRQRHIADATGLTVNHVTKTLKIFQRSGLLELKHRSLRIVDMMELQRIADWDK